MNFQCYPTSIKVFTSSQYVVNNSFHCGLQHKRVSIDTGLFSLVHKKLLRKALIEKKFEETLRHPNFGTFSCSRGFKGKTLSQFSASSFKRGTPKVKEQQLSRRNQSHYLSPTREYEDKVCWQIPQSNTTRPNLMCNLSLYRRGWKRSEAKKKGNSMGVIENSAKIKTQVSSSLETPKIRIKTVI